MKFDSLKRPVRIDGAEDAPIRWLFKQHFVELAYMDRLYWIRVRPCDHRGRALSMEKIFWPVREYSDRGETAKHINRLLSAACAGIENEVFQTCTAKSYTQDGPLVSYLNRVKDRRYKIKVLENELSVVKQAKQLTLI